VADASNLFRAEGKARGLTSFARMFPKEINFMTLMLIEDDWSEEEQFAQQTNPTVKCGWCGEIIRLDGNELALAMCQSCYEGMLAEFVRVQQAREVTVNASDR